MIVLIVCGCVILIPIFIKLYLLFISGRCNSNTCLVGKTAIITGANSGIGYYTALELAKRGCRVILACRNLEKAEAAKNKIIEETSNEQVVVMLVDMTSLTSVRHFATEFRERESRLDILVNNAGGIGYGPIVTEDNMPITMQTNYFSAVLLTHLLLDKLKASTPSRVVNVSSSAAMVSRMSIEDLNTYPKNRYIPDEIIYANSKLCNILYTVELAKKLSGSGITVNCLHPGCVRTQAYRNLPKLTLILCRILGILFFKSGQEGAQTIIHLCTSREVCGVSGGLFEDCKQIQLYRSARNSALAVAVWDKTRELLLPKSPPALLEPRAAMKRNPFRKNQAIDDD